MFRRESTLMAQRFDANSSQIIGAPFRIVAPVGDADNGVAAFSVSDNGVLAYRKGSAGGVESWSGLTEAASGRTPSAPRLLIRIQGCRQTGKSWRCSSPRAVATSL